MPAQFAVSADNLKTVLAELRKIDPNLRKELQREMKTEVKPLLNRLKVGIPSSSPLSGFARANPVRRDGKPNYARWATVNGTVRTPLSKRAKKPGFYPVVSLRFRSRKGNAGFEIMELAGSKNLGRSRSGLTPQGRAMISALNSRYPMQGGLGRFVIPQFRESGGDATRAAKQVLEKFAAKVNRRLR